MVGEPLRESISVCGNVSFSSCIGASCFRRLEKFPPSPVSFQGENSKRDYVSGAHFHDLVWHHLYLRSVRSNGFFDLHTVPPITHTFVHTYCSS